MCLLLILGFLPSRPVRNKCLLFKPPSRWFYQSSLDRQQQVISVQLLRECQALGRPCNDSPCYYYNTQTTAPLMLCCSYSITCLSLLLDCQFLEGRHPVETSLGLQCLVNSPEQPYLIAVGGRNGWRLVIPEAPSKEAALGSQVVEWRLVTDWFAQGNTAGKPNHMGLSSVLLALRLCRFPE